MENWEIGDGVGAILLAKSSWEEDSNLLRKRHHENAMALISLSCFSASFADSLSDLYILVFTWEKESLSWSSRCVIDYNNETTCDELSAAVALHSIVQLFYFYGVRVLRGPTLGIAIIKQPYLVTSL